MVQRTTPQPLDRFVGVVKDIAIEPDNFNDGCEQYHIIIAPEGLDIKGATGMMHEWIKIPPKATPTSVPEGSILDRYLGEIEVLFPHIKTTEKHLDAINELKGKRCTWVKKVLGKSFDNHPSPPRWVPTNLNPPPPN